MRNCTVHPRTRGEHLTKKLRTRNVRGSSPHTRGTSHGGDITIVRRRFIPAHAGNIYRRSCEICEWTVHPRTRGEHPASDICAGTCCGSSPHTRGTYMSLGSGNGGSRFIPAHAGNITSWWNWGSGATVHPRTRGEHSARIRHEPALFGSSPHTRGTSEEERTKLHGHRFIPAHAGNILSWKQYRTEKPVHPRTRGEHDTPNGKPIDVPGSSPHTRGTLGYNTGHFDPVRFIPAHAGNIHHHNTQNDGGTVHPRTRGEHIMTPCSRNYCTGSSPHTRGT